MFIEIFYEVFGQMELFKFQGSLREPVNANATLTYERVCPQAASGNCAGLLQRLFGKLAKKDGGDMKCIWILVALLSLGSVSLAAEGISWKCEDDQRAKGGAFESVEVLKNGSLHKLIFTYVPAPESALPSLEKQVLVENLHCRFYMTQEILQCVSTNFKRFISTERLSRTGESHDFLKISIQSDLLIWPKEYEGLKTHGQEEFVIDLKSKSTFCGFFDGK